MSGLFLSYSRADRALADQIIRGLRVVGVAVWWDEDMRGVDWQMELEHRISELAGVMVIWTPHSINSNPVRDEARLGLETDKLVNVLSGVTKPPFPYDRINGLPLDGWTGREPHRGWTRLVETVEELVVQNGGARPGDITVAQAMREEEVRRKQAAIAAAQEASQTAEAREAEAVETAQAAAATATHAEEQLQRVAGMGVTPLILKAAQQEFESARAAKVETEQARRATRTALDEASRAVAQAKGDLEALFSAVVAPPVLPARRGPPVATKSRPAVRAAPAMASEAPSEATAQARKPRAASRPQPQTATTPPRVAPAPTTAPDPVPLGQPVPAAATAAVAAPGGAVAWPHSVRGQWANPTTRWIAIAGTIGVVAVILIASFARHGPTSPAPGSSLAVASRSPSVGQSSAPAAANNTAAALVGAWAMPGFTCDDPVTLAVNGDVLSVTSGGNTEKAAIQPSTQAGVVNAQFSEGAYSYTLHRNHTLSVVDPSGAAMKMTKCAG